MTLVQCLYCKHVWNLESKRLPSIGEKLDNKTLTVPCPNCGLVRDLLYVGTDTVVMRTKFAQEDLEIMKNAVDFMINARTKEIDP